MAKSKRKTKSARASRRKVRRCACGADVIPGTGACFVCSPAYPSGARDDFFAVGGGFHGFCK